jgi:hypothetical protein
MTRSRTSIISARSRAVCRFGDVQGSLVTGSHEHVCERPHSQLPDAPQFDPERYQGLHQAEAHGVLVDARPWDTVAEHIAGEGIRS